MLEPPEPKGKLDAETVNGPEDETLDWDAIVWPVHENVRRLRQRIFKATKAQDLATVRNLQKMTLLPAPSNRRTERTSTPPLRLSALGLLEPYAATSGTYGSEGGRCSNASGLPGCVGGLFVRALYLRVEPLSPSS